MNFFGVSVSRNIWKAFFWENIRNLLTLDDKDFLGVIFFLFFFFFFSSLGWKVQDSISGNIRKGFFWEIVRIFLILELESSISWNVRHFWWVDSFLFFELGMKSGPSSPIYYYSRAFTIVRLHKYESNL